MNIANIRQGMTEQIPKNEDIIEQNLTCLCYIDMSSGSLTLSGLYCWRMLMIPFEYLLRCPVRLLSFAFVGFRWLSLAFVDFRLLSFALDPMEVMQLTGTSLDCPFIEL